MHRVDTDSNLSPVFVDLPSLHIEEYGTTATISKNKHNDQNEPLLNNQNMKTNEKEALIYTNNGKELKKLFKIQYYKDEKSLKFSIDLKKKESKDQGLLGQLRYFSFYQACLAEFIGTFILVFFAIGFGLNSDPCDATGILNGGLVTGLLIGTLIWGLAHVSGCNINPAVSLAFLIRGDTNILRVLFYIPCQLLGSILAVSFLQEMVIKVPNISEISSNKTVQAIGLTSLHPSMLPAQAFGIEVIITFILILTIFSCVDTERKDLSGSFPLSVGFSVTVGALFGGKFTGGSMNPARSFGPALIAGDFSNHWVYWIGPFTGAVFATLTYKILTFKTSFVVTEKQNKK